MTPASRLDHWLPPVALMGLIFFLSAQPDLSSGLGTWDLLLRKCAHMTEYALLCALWWRALRTVIAGRRALGVAFALTVAYAVTDEVHQTFVPGRHGAAVDVLVDAAGAAIAAVLIARRALIAGRT